MKKIYVCNDTITGIFSAIYDAWKEGREEKECGIAIKGMLEQELFCEYILVEENLHKEQAVERLIRKHLGGQAYADIWHASLASDKDKADAIYGTMLAARRLRDSKKVMEHLSHPQVERVFELSRKVESEAHNYKGFLRFRELSGGILYGGIAPKNRILTCIAPHFANRLPQENWLIHDKTHHMYAVHEAGIVHRDIKPSNIMVRPDGSICLLDFGIAKDLDNNNGNTIPGSILGTNGYMSPEQAAGYSINYRSDIYAVGCVFFYMLTGHHAFNTLSNEFETKDSIINDEFPKLSKYKKGISDVLQKVLDKATAKNMMQRYQSCYEFMSALSNGTNVSNISSRNMPVKISVGREMCDIIVNDSARKISRHHADIELKEFTGGKYYVFTDCSSNGTIVNRKSVCKTSVNPPAGLPRRFISQE